MPETTALSNVPLSLSPRAYQIEEVKESECAQVIFARHIQTSICRVIKILQPYKDTRYSLETLEERQGCQLEALRQNRRFTPEVYLGLAPVEELDMENRQLSLGHVLEDPTQETLESGREYALVMQRLPENDRLDHVLQKGKRAQLQEIMQLLAEKITIIHNKLAPPLSEQDALHWGGEKHLQSKLLHNLALLELIPRTASLEMDDHQQLEKRLTTLSEGLLEKFLSHCADGYFEQRRVRQVLKHCHGDLKTPHIWMTSFDSGGCPHGDFQDERRMLLLDAADFNPSYTHIDILSDIALLAADIQARTNSFALANRLLESYLEMTGQRDEVSRAVLGYYLVEKAIVGAAVSLVYDHLPELGHAFLHVAEQRLEDLMCARSV